MADLRQYQGEAGGPVSLTQFLRLSSDAISTMRLNRVSWTWMSSRVIAVHQTPPEVDIPEDIPLARRRTARLVATLWARIADEVPPLNPGENGSDGISKDRNQASPPPNDNGHDESVEAAKNKTAGLATGPPKRAPTTLTDIIQDHENIEQLGRFNG